MLQWGQRLEMKKVGKQDLCFEYGISAFSNF